MDASFDHASPLREIVPGRFAWVSVQTPAGEIEARLSERGNWELRVRRDQEMSWRLACTGDLDCGIVTTQPVAAAQEEVIALGALMVDPAGRRTTVRGREVSLARRAGSSRFCSCWQHTLIGSTRRRSYLQLSEFVGHKTPKYQLGAARITLQVYTYMLPGELERARVLFDKFLVERAEDDPAPTLTLTGR